MLFVPSLINPPNVLDMGERSLLRWLAGRGRRVLLLDWGWPGPDRRAMSVAGHVERDPAAADGGSASRSTWSAIAWAGRWRSPRPRSAGRAASRRSPRPGISTAFPTRRARELARLWASAQPTVGALGLLPMEVLQCAFWSLDPARTVAKFEAFAALDGEEARTFVMLEDWANDGPPISEAAAREMFESLFAADVTGPGDGRSAARSSIPTRSPVPCSTSSRPPTASSPHATAPAPASGSISRSAMSAWWSAAGAGNALGAAGRLAFPHCSKLLGAPPTP